MEQSERTPPDIEAELKYGPLALQLSISQRSGTQRTGCRREVVTGLGKDYTPFNMPDDFELGQTYSAHSLHFETDRLRLYGDLRKKHSDGKTLLSNIWNFVRVVFGEKVFDELLIFNSTPWSAPHDADSNGQSIIEGVGPDVLARIAELQAEYLLGIGDCVLLTSCGGAARAWYEFTGIAELFGMGEKEMGCVRAADPRPIASNLPVWHLPTVVQMSGQVRSSADLHQVGSDGWTLREPFCTRRPARRP
jgi:hypothetical protein